MKPYKVLIADDHAEFRRIIRSFLDRLSHVVVVGEAVDGFDAVEKADELRPDIILMDIAMPRQDGLSAARVIKERFPSTRVVIISIHDDPIYRTSAEEANADGYILKSALKAKLEGFLNGTIG